METTRNLLEDFIQLFRGRGDAYGGWEGVCVRRPLTPQVFESHLNGSELIGVYPLVPFEGGWGCVWGCTDIDVDDLDAARNLQMALSMKNIVSWVERTRKGYHVWVFANTLVPASTMRRALLSAHQAINYPAKEVNPKQEDPGSGFGNYVRLPYPKGYAGIPENRYVMDDDDKPLELERFIDLAIINRNNREELQDIADLFRLPPVQQIRISEVSHDVKLLLRRASAIPFLMWRDGPLEGSDRSGTLIRMAYRLKEDNFQPDEVFSLVRSADERWGKFYLRPDGDKEIANIVQKVFNE
jgi:hypothetical protein